MTQYTVRAMAKELAGAFYEQKRSGRFRSMDSMTRAKSLKQFPDGTVREVVVVVPFRVAYPDSQTFANAHWPFFVQPARECLVAMLALPDSRVSPDDKAYIFEALKEEKQKRDKAGGGSLLHQRKAEPWQNQLRGAV